MECGFCMREYSTRRKPLCVICVRAALYGPRVRQATALLDREKAHTHAEAIIRPGNDGVLASLPDDADLDAITSGIKKHSYDRSRAERDAAEYRVTQILDHAKDLRSEMEQYQRTIEIRRQKLEHRRKDLAARRGELDKQRSRAMDPVAATIKKASQRLDRTRYKIVEARSLLCREAASASNFQRRKGPEGRSVYVLGGIAIPDLRLLNTKTQAVHRKTAVGGRVIEEPHDSVSESFDNVARLLNLCAHYLSVRLPAEIILPHEDFPRAMINPEKSSYKVKNIPFPGVTTGQTSSPAGSRVVDRNQPRPRPLWLDGPLAQLSKEDKKSYDLYVEGITLLAWDVAWLCKTQGIDNISSYEDACNIGRNLYQLLLSSRKQAHRASLDRRDTTASGKNTPAQDLRLGLFSHTSVTHNLAGAAGMDLLKDWKMVSSARFADKLRSNLLAEISGAEWDFLEEEEWDEDREEERPVMVGGSRRPQESKYAAMSVISVKPSDGADDDELGSASDAKRRSNTGWMKVRERSDG